jgi:hypothetical protein
MYYNFARAHQTLRLTRAMEAGVADHVWSIDEIVRLLDHHGRDDGYARTIIPGMVRRIFSNSRLSRHFRVRCT